MSLITTASTWINDNNNNVKKRPSVLKRTIKLKPINNNSTLQHDDYISQSENYQNLKSNSFEENQNVIQERNNKVNDLLNKITSIDNDESDKLGNFQPLPNPNIHVKKDYQTDEHSEYYEEPTNYYNSINKQKNANYTANDFPVGNLSSYKTSYEKPLQYLNDIGHGKNISNINGIDNKVLEKINYMIHLLEEQQLEKTNNITEEFILYSFLGVFIIFVVDSFSRSGKYIR